jgi:hypothetical protein
MPKGVMKSKDIAPGHLLIGWSRTTSLADVSGNGDLPGPLAVAAHNNKRPDAQ